MYLLIDQNLLNFLKHKLYGFFFFIWAFFPTSEYPESNVHNN